MEVAGLLPKLKAELLRNHPNLADIFSDPELQGMLDESSEWCPPGCVDEDHCHVEHAVKIASRVAAEQELSGR